MEGSGFGDSPYEIISRLAMAYDDIGNDLYSIAMSSYKSSIACVSGCAHCCHLNSTVQTRTKSNAVGMTLLDGVVLLEYLISIRHTQAARTMLENVNAVWRDMPNTLERLPCPFDAAGQCTVYSARPKVCRLYFSNDAAHCETQAVVPANVRQVDTQVARVLRPIRRELNSKAKSVLESLLPKAVFGYFDFMTTAHTIVTAVMKNEEDQIRSGINTRQSF